MRRPFPLLFALFALGSTSCNEVGPHVVLELVTGGETDALTRAPAPASVAIEASDGAGAKRTLARTSPKARFDLGPIDRGTLLSLDYRAKDDAGKMLLTGTSLPLEIGGGDEATVRLFVQRTNEMARLPGALAINAPSPLVDRLGRRYLTVASGDRAELFDLANFSTTTFALPFVPASIVTTASGLLVFDDTRAALVDLTGTSRTVEAPSGISFADVAGGTLVRSAAGVAYVVGGSRERASNVILRVALDGALSILRTSAARQNGAAAFVEQAGVVVVGGATDQSAGEIVADDGAVRALAYPSIALGERASAVALDERRVVVVGGSLAARVFDTSCTAACATNTFGVEVPAFGGAPALARVSDGSILLLVADASNGASLQRIRESSAPSAVPLKTQRSGARLVTGTLPNYLVVGGASTIESYASE